MSIQEALGAVVERGNWRQVERRGHHSLPLTLPLTEGTRRGSGELRYAPNTPHICPASLMVCVCVRLRGRKSVYLCVYNNTYKEREIESVCMYVCVRDRLKIVERDRECVYVCVRWR